MNAFTELLARYQYFGWLAFIVTVFGTPLAIRLAYRYGVLDVPDQVLKPHARPIPYLGGAAVCAGWAVAMLAAMVSGVADWRSMLPVFLGGLAMSMLGLVDDVRHVAPKIRLAAGTVIVTAVILFTGTGFRLVSSVVEGLILVAGECGVTVPAGFTQALTLVGVPLSVVLGVFIVLGACNSTNLIDGLDGLCSGVTGIISVGFFFLAAHLAALYPGQGGDALRLVLSMAMLGAALGFLPWNFNPAKIFLGDAGSMLLGYNCGLLILLSAERGILRWVLGALMIFALPVFDTVLAMVRRWRARRSIFEGDRSHFYDQLVQRGLTVRQTVLICYALAIAFAALGLLVISVRTRYAFFVYAVACVLTMLGAWASGLMTPERRPSGSEPADDAA